MGILSKMYTGKKVKEMAKGQARTNSGQARPASTLPQRRPVTNSESSQPSTRTVASQTVVPAPKEVESVVKEPVVAPNYEVSVYDKEKYEAELKEFLEIQIQTVIDTQASKYEQRLEEYKEALSLYKKCLSVYEDRLEEIGSVSVSQNDGYKDEVIQDYDNKLGQYEERVQSYDNKLGEMDERVKRYDSRLGEYASKVRDYDERVQDYDSRLGEFDERVREYDEKVKGYDHKLGEYDAKVQSYDSRLGVYDEKVRDYDSRLGEYDEKVKGYDNRLEEYTSQLKHYEEKLAHYEKQNISDQETTRKINTDIEFIKAESEKIKRQIEEIKIEPDEEFTKSIEKMLTSQEGVGEFIKNFDARVGAVLKEDSEEKKKVASYQFDMLMEMIKKGNSDNKQMLLGVLGINFILLIFNIILIFMAM